MRPTPRARRSRPARNSDDDVCRCCCQIAATKSEGNPAVVTCSLLLIESAQRLISPFRSRVMTRSSRSQPLSRTSKSSFVTTPKAGPRGRPPVNRCARNQAFTRSANPKPPPPVTFTGALSVAIAFSSKQFPKASALVSHYPPQNKLVLIWFGRFECWIPSSRLCRKSFPADGSRMSHTCCV